MADTLDSTGKYVPKDLQITSQPDSVDKNKFKIVIDNLKIDSSYAFQFQYVFPDGELSDWSPGYTLLTNTESVPTAPSVAVSSSGSGVIPVTLNTFPTNAKRVDVYVIGGIYGAGKVAYSFFAAGTHNISAAAGSYQVVLLTVTPSSVNGDPTSTFNCTVTDPTANLQVDPSVTPSTPTVSSVLGAIQLSWNGKTSSGGDQPNGFVAAKVYVGTTSGFTPVDTGQSGANQVDVLNFGNGQNTLNIAVGTVVNGVAMTYNTNYYIKIKTTNGNTAQDSSAVLATGSPAQIGKVGSGDIITITADQITTGTISSQTVTVGAIGGKRVELRGSGNPIEIFGTGGTSLLAYNTGSNKLTITGDGSFTGDISGATGTLTNALNVGSYNLGTWGGRGYPFSVNSSGNIEAGSGTIGGWTINTTQIRSSGSNYISLNPLTPKIALVQGSTEVITIDPVGGIVGPDKVIQGESRKAFKITPDGNAALAGDIYADNGKIGGWTITSNTLSGSNITLSSSGSITNSGSISGFFQTYVPASATLSSGYLNISLSENTVATVGAYGGLGSDGGIYIQNNTNKLTLSPVSLYLQSTSTQNGVIPGGFYITHASGDYDIHFGFSGYDGTQYVRRITWDHWGIPAQRDSDNFANIYDANGQSLRPLVVDSDGGMGLGYTQYFSTTQTTTPSSGTGRNGDLFFSTA